jgi:hypothetical protein
MRLHFAKVIAPGLFAVLAAASNAYAAGGAVPGAPDRYESAGSVRCTAGSFCRLVFAAVPAGSVLEATNISCDSALSSAGSLDYVEFVVEAGTFRKPHEKVSFPVHAVQPGHFLMNEAMRFFYDAGAQPWVVLSQVPSDATGFLLCTLSGSLLKRAA